MIANYGDEAREIFARRPELIATETGVAEALGLLRPDPLDKMDVDELIADVLRNETYLPESGLYANLAKSLRCLPVGRLRDLAMIVRLKTDK
jgi:hypothetical protein